MNETPTFTVVVQWAVGTSSVENIRLALIHSQNLGCPGNIDVVSELKYAVDNFKRALLDAV